MENKPAKADLLFVIEGPWEMDERRMEGDRRLRGPSDSWGCLRETRETGDGIGFPNKGVSAQQVTAMPVRASYVISLPSAAASSALLIRWGNNKETEEQTEGGKKL